jgi:FMN phosphatase YigB (HAD superfamily)
VGVEKRRQVCAVLSHCLSESPNLRANSYCNCPATRGRISCKLLDFRLHLWLTLLLLFSLILTRLLSTKFEPNEVIWPPLTLLLPRISGTLDRQLDLAKEKLREPWYRENISAILAELNFPASNRLIEKITWAFQDSWVGGLRIPPENRAALERLAHSYHLGIVTNFQQPNIIPDILTQFRIQEFFDPVVISAAIGCRKPHPAIFETALVELKRKKKAEKAECVVYVGDNPEEDVDGASLVGLRPVLMDTRNQHTGLANPVPRIRCLAELFDVLPTL